MTFSLCLALTSLQTETWLNGVSGVCFWRALAFCCSLSDIPTLLNATTQPQWRTQRRHRDTARVWYLNTWARKPRVTVTSGTNTKQVEETSTQISVLCVCVLYNNVMERVTFYLLPLWQAEDGNVPHDWVTVSLLLLILAFIKTEWVHLPFMIKGLITACNDGKLLPTCCMLTLLAQRLQGRIQLKKGCHLWKCLCGKNCFPLLICVLIDQYK